MHIDTTVKMKGDVVGGIRINKIQPNIKKQKPNFTEANFEKAKKAGATKEQILSVYEMSEETFLKYTEYGTEK